MKQFLSAMILAAAMVLAAGEAQGADVAALIDAIRTAPDFRAAGSAYVDARREARENPEVYRVYIERLLTFDKARLAFLPAQDLLKLKPDEPMALGVVGYAQAQRNQLAQAYEAYVRAAATGTDNAGILYSAGIACAWQASENPPDLSEETKAVAKRHQAAWNAREPFRQGQAVAKDAYKKWHDHLSELDEKLKDARRELQAAKSQDADAARRYEDQVAKANAAAIKMRRAADTIANSNRATGGGGALHEHYKNYLAQLQRDYYQAEAEQKRAVHEARSLVPVVKARQRRIAAAQRTLDSAESARQQGEKAAPEFPWQPPTVGDAALPGTSVAAPNAPQETPETTKAPPPENLPQLVAAITQATTLSDAGAAYATACRTARHCPEVHHAFITMLLAAGQPNMVGPAARQLAALDPSDALAQGVLGYLSARSGHLADALNATVRAGVSDGENPGVLNNLAFLTLWRQTEKSAPGVDPETDALISKHLSNWRSRKAFQDAQVTAAKSISERTGAIAQAKTRLQQARRKRDDEERKDPNAQITYDRAITELNVARRQLEGRNASVQQMRQTAANNSDPTYAAQLARNEAELRKAQISFEKANRSARDAATVLKARLARLKQAQNDVEAAQAACERAEQIVPQYEFLPPTVQARTIPAGNTATKPPTTGQDTTGAPKPTPTTESDDEADAAKQLSFAKMLLTNNRRHTAIEKLKALVEKYPDTPAGREAHTMLTEIYSGRK